MFNRLCQPRFVLLLLLVTCIVRAERYQVDTGLDGSALVRPVEPEETVISSEPEVTESSAGKEDVDASSSGSGSKRLRVRGVSDAQSETALPQSNDNSHITSPPQGGDEPGKEVSVDTKSQGIFEQRLLESEGKTRDELLKDLSENAVKEREKIIILDGVRYIDGEALLKDESLADEGARYFTTIDNEGRAHNIYFSPEMEKRARKELREKKIQYTSATEYVQQLAPTDEDSVPAKINGVDSKALEILGAASPASYFSAFLEYCCQRLPNRIAHDLESGVPLFFDLKSSDAPYRFSEGDSRYVLIRLPEDADDIAVRIKSFIKEFRKQGINHGVFYPQVTLLSKEKKPLRMIRDASFDFTGETWSNYGYLEGLFRVSRKVEGAEEFFLLIHTDRGALNKSSYFELDQELIQVLHMPTGSLSVEIVSQN